MVVYNVTPPKTTKPPDPFHLASRLVTLRALTAAAGSVHDEITQTLAMLCRSRPEWLPRHAPNEASLLALAEAGIVNLRPDLERGLPVYRILYPNAA